MTTFTLPKVADSTDDYVVVSVEVAVDDEVTPDTVVLVVETDKVDADVRAGFSGVVTGVLVEEGAEISSGDPVLEYREMS